MATKHHSKDSAKQINLKHTFHTIITSTSGYLVVTIIYLSYEKRNLKTLPRKLNLKVVILYNKVCNQILIPISKSCEII